MMTFFVCCGFFLMFVVLSASIWLNFKCIRKNLELADQREFLVDQIEESLDILEDVHASLQHASEIPVLSDEPVIREVVADIKKARNAVLAVASLVVTYGVEPGQKDED